MLPTRYLLLCGLSDELGSWRQRYQEEAQVSSSEELEGGRVRVVTIQTLAHQRARRSVCFSPGSHIVPLRQGPTGTTNCSCSCCTRQLSQKRQTGVASRGGWARGKRQQGEGVRVLCRWYDIFRDEGVLHVGKEGREGCVHW